MDGTCGRRVEWVGRDFFMDFMGCGCCVLRCDIGRFCYCFLFAWSVLLYICIIAFVDKLHLIHVFRKRIREKMGEAREDERKRERRVRTDPERKRVGLTFL